MLIIKNFKKLFFNISKQNFTESFVYNSGESKQNLSENNFELNKSLVDKIISFMEKGTINTKEYQDIIKRVNKDRENLTEFTKSKLAELLNMGLNQNIEIDEYNVISLLEKGIKLPAKENLREFILKLESISGLKLNYNLLNIISNFEKKGYGKNNNILIGLSSVGESKISFVSGGRTNKNLENINYIFAQEESITEKQETENLEKKEPKNEDQEKKEAKKEKKFIKEFNSAKDFYYRVKAHEEQIKKIQEKVGLVQDGIFTQITFIAIKKYQKENNLYIDGKAGKNTLLKMGLIDKTKKISDFYSKKETNNLEQKTENSDKVEQKGENNQEVNDSVAKTEIPSKVEQKGENNQKINDLVTELENPNKVEQKGENIQENNDSTVEPENSKEKENKTIFGDVIPVIKQVNEVSKSSFEIINDLIGNKILVKIKNEFFFVPRDSKNLVVGNNSKNYDGLIKELKDVRNTNNISLEQILSVLKVKLTQQKIDFKLDENFNEQEKLSVIMQIAKEKTIAYHDLNDKGIVKVFEKGDNSLNLQNLFTKLKKENTQYDNRDF